MKPVYQGLIVVFFLLLLKAHPALAQEASFNLVPPPDENPWNIVLGITQDKQGYMWFAGNGIHRYDGKQVINYRNDPLNSNTIANNAVECLFTDSNGIIWAGTLGAGLDRFDPDAGKFSHNRHDAGNPASLINDTITAIAEDQEGNLWIGTHGGLEQLDTKTGKFVHYSHSDNNAGSISNNHVRTVYVDRSNTVWAGTGSPFINDAGVTKDEGGLNRFDKATGKFIRYLHNPTDSTSLIDNRIRAIFEDSHGTFWIGTAGDGLHSLDRTTGKFTRYRFDPAHPERLSRSPLKKTFPWVDDHITFIKEDVTGKLWIGTMMGGITSFNPATKQLTRYGTGSDSSTTFADKSGWAAYTSRDGMLWISTWSAHLFRVDPFRESFPYVNIGDRAECVYRDSTNNTWICTRSALVRLSATGKILKKYPIKLPGQATVISVISMIADHNGILWIGMNPGLLSFDPQTEKFKLYMNNPEDHQSIYDNLVTTIVETRENELWIGTLGSLDKLDRKTGKFFHYRREEKNTNTMAMNIVRDIFIDRKNQFWLGTGDGVNQFDPQTGHFKPYLIGTEINSLFEDAAGVIWVGAAEGLFRFNQPADSFTVVTDPGPGLRFKNIWMVNEDIQKQLWLYSTGAAHRFNQQRDSVNLFVNNFGLKNILTGGLINGGQKGEVFLADGNGYFDVNSDRVKVNPIPPQISFTDFRLGEQSVVPGNDSPLKEPVSQAKQIELNYRQNLFSFDFDILHFGSSGNNQHLFKLENYDDRWHQETAEHRAFYFNVPPGRYTFRVKAANSNGIWTEKSILIIVRPPWWLTWWAYTLYGLSVIAMIFLANYLIRRRILEKENDRNRQKELEHAREIEKAYQELKLTQAQLIQAEKMASLGELTAGIAHEIQNPLNFVNNFSEINTELLEELKNQKSIVNNGDEGAEGELIQSIIENEKKINHHGKRADSIVKGMLQHSRSSSGQKEPSDINALTDEFFRLSFHGLRAKDKDFNASLHTDFDPGIGKINIIPQDIGRVLLNLFNNAFYAVNEKRKNLKPGEQFDPAVWVSTKKKGNSVVISVKDNGNGISKNIADKIFQPFFTTKPTGQGTGLGLSLSYDIIKAHGGVIDVKSNEEEGTEFIITLIVKR